MAKKDFGAIIGDLVVDLSPEALEVKTGKGKKQQVDAEATFQNVTANLAYYGGMFIGLDAIAGDVPGLDEAIAEHKEAYDVLFAYASENLEGFDEYAETVGLESFGTQDADGDAFDFIADLDRADLAAIAKHLEIKVMKKDDADAIIGKITEEVEEDALAEALSELGYYDEEEDAEEEGEEEPEEEEASYADMSLGELRKECKSRGIKYTPKEKAEALVAKLEEDDANGEEEEESGEEDGADYSEMSLSELRAECKERGIKYSPKQKAADLIALLEESDAEEEGEEEPEEEEASYADMSLGELRKECKSRGIKYTPKEKAEALVAKLEEDDANGEEEEESGEEDGAEEVDEHELDEILDEEFEDEVLAEEEKASGKGKGGRKLPKKK